MSSDPRFDEMMARYVAGVAERGRLELAKAAGSIAAFTEIAAEVGIRLSVSSFEYIQAIGVVASASGLAAALLKPLPRERDGLFGYNDLAKGMPTNPFQAGYFVGRDYMLMAHPYYRRQMHPSANWAPRFVELLWELELPGVKKYVAIDEDRVRINVNNSAYFEGDTWYGAPFNEDVRKIKSGTVKLRPPPDLEAHHVDFFFAQAYSLDIKWAEADDVKTFQALEIKTEQTRIEIEGRTYFPARYIHAEFDMAENCFRHFDGAVQFFLEEEYFQRRDSDFNMTAKNAEHIKARSKKLFKLNGPITTETWVELCCHFYTANPLTFEYFNGAYPAHIVEVLGKIQAIKTEGANDA